MKKRIKISGLRKAEKKLKNNNGETLVETLVTMIIMVLSVMIITGAIVTGAKVNHKTDNSATAFSTENQKDTTGTITITENSSNSNQITLNVNIHTTKNDYTYYESQE